MRNREQVSQEKWLQDLENLDLITSLIRTLLQTLRLWKRLPSLFTGYNMVGSFLYSQVAALDGFKFFEHQFSDMLDIPSTSKSPHEMFGVIAKTYYANKIGIDPQDMYVVSVMPCLAKKYEAARPELSHDDMQDVDTVITTRELAKMLKEANIDLMSLEDEDF